jgi:hypothetical protein
MGRRRKRVKRRCGQKEEEMGYGMAGENKLWGLVMGFGRSW